MLFKFEYRKYNPRRRLIGNIFCMYPILMMVLSAVPIVFNFHGYGGNVEEFMEYGDLRSVAETNTFILVYPQGSCLEGSSALECLPKRTRQ